MDMFNFRPYLGTWSRPKSVRRTTARVRARPNGTPPRSPGATACAKSQSGRRWWRSASPHVTLFATGSAGHGYTDSPISRQKLCANGTVTNCGSIQWEPQSVEGPKGFPAAGPADGKICSAGLTQFAQLDDPRGGAWPTTQLTSGQSYSFRWQFTARHATTDFKYYITKNGWNGTQKLTRAMLDPQPFLTVPYNNQQPLGDPLALRDDPGGQDGPPPDPGGVDDRGHRERVLRVLGRQVLTAGRPGDRS